MIAYSENLKIPHKKNKKYKSLSWKDPFKNLFKGKKTFKVFKFAKEFAVEDYSYYLNYWNVSRCFNVRESLFIHQSKIIIKKVFFFFNCLFRKILHFFPKMCHVFIFLFMSSKKEYYTNGQYIYLYVCIIFHAFSNI